MPTEHVFVIAVQEDVEALEGFRWSAYAYADWRAHDRFVGCTTNHAHVAGALNEMARLLRRRVETPLRQR